jgi:hypothetical protein
MLLATMGWPEAVFGAAAMLALAWVAREFFRHG